MKIATLVLLSIFFLYQAVFSQLLLIADQVSIKMELVVSCSSDSAPNGKTAFSECQSEITCDTCSFIFLPQQLDNNKFNTVNNSIYKFKLVEHFYFDLFRPPQKA